MSEISPLALYLNEMHRIRNTGLAKDEVSYYPALEAALNAVGHRLKPRVVCIQHPKGKKGDHPDLGLFEMSSAKMLPPDWIAIPIPGRGVVEAKPLTSDMDGLQQSPQVSNYLNTFGLVLITNYREFRLLRRNGMTIEMRERVELAEDEGSFWGLKSDDNQLAISFSEFLQRALLYSAPLRTSEEVAFFLASYAREAMAKLETHSALPALANLRVALEKALGIEFRDADGERLFRSTLVQTLFYGLFSAWVLRCEAGNTAPFDWRSAGFHQSVPVMSLLFSEAAQPHHLGKMLGDLLDRATGTLSRIQGADLSAFLEQFHERSAMAYFYEPFLKAFDPETRERLGVWYTPPEIVEYMVERVDRVLRTELGRGDGLADEKVWVLDPCCGTGSFLVEVLRRIRKTLEAQGKGDLVGPMLHAAATTRVVGFEIMTAPFVIAHWQVAEALRETKAPMKTDGSERAAIYLTNALTGWRLPTGILPTLPGFEVLAEERDQAGAVKRDRPILVVLRNPPYNAYVGTSPQEEEGIVEHYKEGLQVPPWKIKKFNLDDLYVRFFRVAERRIEATGTGIVCFISNASWITERSFVVMRQSLTSTFDRAWIENMHGNRKISERGPDGHTSQTIFAMRGLSPGIRQGVSITLLARTKQGDHVYRFRDDINASSAEDRRSQLLATLEETDFDNHYGQVEPTETRWYRLAPGEAKEEYAEWASITELAGIEPINGLMEKRGGALMDVDRPKLEARMQAYCNPKIDDTTAAAIAPRLMVKRARFDPIQTRRRVQEQEGFLSTNLKEYFLRPFDLTWAYATGVRPLWNEPRPRLLHLLPDSNGFLASRPAGVADPEGWPVMWTMRLGDNDAQRGHAYYFPVVENLSGAPRPNLSAATETYLAGLGIASDTDSARLIWMHVLAITYSPAWLNEHADGIRYGWPRVPLPDGVEQLRYSAKLGEQVAALLNPDKSVAGVTSDSIRPELVTIARLTALDGIAPDLNVAAGWGSTDRQGRVNPGSGRTQERDYGPCEGECAIKAPVLGSQTLDVFLNSHTFWRNVPQRVWDTHIGGYQVLKKWLSYRESSILGRAITPNEANHVTETCRRIAALLLLGTDLDENYAACATASVALIGKMDGPEIEGDDKDAQELVEVTS